MKPAQIIHQYTNVQKMMQGPKIIGPYNRNFLVPCLKSAQKFSIPHLLATLTFSVCELRGECWYYFQPERELHTSASPQQFIYVTGRHSQASHPRIVDGYYLIARKYSATPVVKKNIRKTKALSQSMLGLSVRAI